MAKPQTKNKKVSVNTFGNIVNENYSPNEVINWNGIEVIITKTLSLEDMLGFVDSVTKSCFTINDNTYLPEVKEFAIKTGVLETYTNISLPSNTEKKYKLIYCSDIFDVVLHYINIQQFEEIVRAIDAKINNLAQANIEMINKQMEELYASFDNLQKQISDTFSNIGADDIPKLINAISNGEIDEKKLVAEYVEQAVHIPENSEDGEAVDD